MAKEKKEKPEIYFMTEEARKIWDRTVRTLKKLGDEAGEITKRWEMRAKEEVVKASKVGRLRLDIVRLTRKREEKFKELGTKAYRLGVEKKIDKPSLKNLCQEIKKIEKEIKDKETESKTLRQSERKGSQ